MSAVKIKTLEHDKLFLFFKHLVVYSVKIDTLGSFQQMKEAKLYKAARKWDLTLIMQKINHTEVFHLFLIYVLLEDVI